MSAPGVDTTPDPRPFRLTRGGVGRALERIGLPALVIASIGINILLAHRRGDLGIDFRTVSPEIRGLVHGTNPFVIESVGTGGHFLWTVLAGWILSPFAWLPHGYLLIVVLEIVGMLGAAL